MRFSLKVRPSILKCPGIAILFVASFLSLSSLEGADLVGARDYPLLKRFGGSEIVGYDVKRFDEYELQTSAYKQYDFKTNRRVYAKPPLHLEGTRTQIWYEAAGPTTATEVIRNYQNELNAKGFEVLYDSTRDPQAVNWNAFLVPFGNAKINTSRSAYVFQAADKKSIRVTTARLKRPQGDIYVALTAIEWTGDHAVYKARRGAYLALDVVEVQGMTQNMVLVSAEQMSDAIRTSGRVALYGIFFDTNKAEIKAESKAALDEIAKLLKSEPNLKLHVVGHTDNVGGYEPNLGLSRRRAEAVVGALTRNYGVSAARLTPNGVAYLAPVAVNTTEEGRAKNRRVELIPQ